MVASSLYFLDLKGKVLISRDYRGDISPDYADSFISVLKEFEPSDDTEGSVAPPIISRNGIHYIYVNRRNSNVMTIMTFLHRVIKVFKDYFVELEEESLRDNFVIIYELLDEMMDFGYPQMSENKVLKEYITQQSFHLEKSALKIPSSALHDKSAIVMTTSTAATLSPSSNETVSWRPDGIKYRKNEVFLDVVETVNLNVNADSQIVKLDIFGEIKARCYLSGIPELKLGLNDKIMFDLKGNKESNLKIPSPLNSPQESLGSSPKAEPTKFVDMDDVKFHQCVRLARFEQDRTIIFIPPDGDFTLLSYRVSQSDLQPPILVDSQIQKWTDSTIEFTVSIRSTFKRRLSANRVKLSIPIPSDADTPRLKPEIGIAYHAPDTSSIVWHVDFLPGSKEFSLSVKVGLPSLSDPNQPPFIQRPLSLSFEIPYHTISGIQVRYLKIIEKSGYSALPWVRYITEGGEYHFRFPDFKKN